MNVRQMSVKELALVKMGLETIYVHDSEKERAKLLEKINKELANRQLGTRLVAVA